MSTMPLEIKNPATGEPLYVLDAASPNECQAIMARARGAAELMRRSSLDERLAAIDALLHYLQRKHRCRVRTQPR